MDLANTSKRFKTDDVVKKNIHPSNLQLFSMGSNTLKDFDIDEENIITITNSAKDFAASKGILMRAFEYTKDTRVILPFCIVPSRVPKEWYNLVYELQPYINEVLFKISHSREFLKMCFSSIVEADEFTGNIYRIYEALDNQQSEQLSLGLIRSDYLLATDSSGNITGVKQVENNTIASSFGGLAPSVTDLHRYVLKRLGKESFLSGLPNNNSANALAKGLIAAWEAYGNPSASILFVVEANTLNICDQRALEHAIVDCNSRIEVLRHTFKDLNTHAKLKDKILFVGSKEVAVVYYRTGYVPQDYKKQDWHTRFLMEQSCAVKCPSAGLHLAGSKRVQSLLTCPGVLEHFVNSDIAEKLRQVFVNQHILDTGTEGDKAIALGIENPYKYVLKPEREGGGNNVYGAGIRTVLQCIKDTNERNAYILMERINPPCIPNCIALKDKAPEIQSIIYELGIFGIILGNQTEINLNTAAGHLLRSKESNRDETGVAAGFGALDSPLLI